MVPSPTFEMLEDTKVALYDSESEDDEKWPENPPATLTHRGINLWRTRCGECKRQGLECEGEPYPCRNCQESGYGNVCPAEVTATAAENQEQSPTDSGGTSYSASEPVIQSVKISKVDVLARRLEIILSKTGDFVYGIIKHLGHLLVHVFSIFILGLQAAYLIILLGLPIYYSSQAHHVRDRANECEQDYREWTTIRSRLEIQGGRSPTGDSNAVELQAMPTVAEPDHSVVMTGQSSPTVESPDMSQSVRLFRDSWQDYVEARSTEWNVCFTLAGFIITAAPSIFQIPEASTDPYIRVFASLAICSSVTVLIYTSIFVIHFRSSHAKDVRYAHLWIKEATKSHKWVIWNPWIMISLPAVAIFWTGIMFMLAILSYVWRSGSVDDPAEQQPIAVKPAFGLRSMITGLFLVALVYMAHSLRTLQRYKTRVLERRNSVGPDTADATNNGNGNGTEM